MITCIVYYPFIYTVYIRYTVYIINLCRYLVEKIKYRGGKGTVE